jgi:hypothetical protein
VFSQINGYKVTLGTGQGTIRPFDELHDGQNRYGAFFGSNIGKARLIATSEQTVIVYVLVPPCQCDLFFISTAKSDILKIGSGGNLSDTPDRTICFWHVSPGKRMYFARLTKTQPTDRFEFYSRGAGEVTQVRNGFSANVRQGVSFFVYRTSGQKNDRSVTFQVVGDDDDPFPTIQALITANHPPTVLVSGDPIVREEITVAKVETSKPQVGQKKWELTDLKALSILAVGLIVVIVRRIGLLLIHSHNWCNPFPSNSQLPKQWTVRNVVGARNWLGEEFKEEEENVGYSPTRVSTSSGMPVVFQLTDETKFAATPSEEVEGEDSFDAPHVWKYKF